MGAGRPECIHIDGQRQGRIGAAGDHQVQLAGQMVEQELHPVMHVTLVDDVVVVKHQHQVARGGREPGASGGQAAAPPPATSQEESR